MVLDSRNETLAPQRSVFPHWMFIVGVITVVFLALLWLEVTQEGLRLQLIGSWQGEQDPAMTLTVFEDTTFRWTQADTHGAPVTMRGTVTMHRIDQVEFTTVTTTGTEHPWMARQFSATVLADSLVLDDGTEQPLYLVRPTE